MGAYATPTSPLWKGRLPSTSASGLGGGACDGVVAAELSLEGLLSPVLLVLPPVRLHVNPQSRTTVDAAASRQSTLGLAPDIGPYGPGQLIVRTCWVETAKPGATHAPWSTRSMVTWPKKPLLGSSETLMSPPFAVTDQTAGRPAVPATQAAPFASQTCVTCTVTLSLGAPNSYAAMAVQAGVPEQVHGDVWVHRMCRGKNSQKFAATVLVTPKSSVTDAERL